MRISFQRDGQWDTAPEDVGIHVCASGVSINPQAEGSYLSLERPLPGALYRLRREGMTVVREAVPGGCEEDDARWWFTKELGGGDYQAIVSDPEGRATVVYVGIGKDSNIWTLDDDPKESVDFQFWDVDTSDRPDIAALAAALATTPEVANAPTP